MTLKFQRGINKPYTEGVYLSKNDICIWDYKIFHENTKEPTYLLAKEYRTNTVVGPMIIEDYDFNKEVERVLELKSEKLYDQITKE